MTTDAAAPLTEDSTEQVADSSPVVSPWLNLYQAADYTGFTYRHMRLQCVQYQRHGDRGLRCAQPDGRYRIHVADLDRWIEGLPPSRGRRKATNNPSI